MLRFTLSRYSLMSDIPNVLAQRYATAPMCAIWSQSGRIILERELWIAIMKAQREMGLPISETAIAAYERVKETVDLEAIRQREAVTRHDVKARIEAFCELAGHEEIHKGMTSRDLTENVEQLQVWRSLQLVRLKVIAAMSRLAERAQAWQQVLLTARTHNVAAQPTTVGKRLAMFGEELLQALERFEHLVNHYAARGLKGAVGTQLDQLHLFDGDASRVAELEAAVARHLGTPQVFSAVGQVYPRSQDHAVVNALYELGSGPASFAKTLRLMAGHELAGEGFAPGQVGSSAMPHKMNSRSCERLNGFHVILRGYLNMTAALAGDQWNEGDVSCSVVRRVALPDSFFAIDGLFETFHTILNQMGINPAVIARENAYYRPFLLTTTVLMAAVKQGKGRETAHEAIKAHAVATLNDLRSGVITENDLFSRLASDDRLGLSSDALDRILKEADKTTGMASQQVDSFIAATQQWTNRYPDAKAYEPGAIL